LVVVTNRTRKWQ